MSFSRPIDGENDGFVRRWSVVRVWQDDMTRSTGLAARFYRRCGTKAMVLRSTASDRACSVALRAWGFRPVKIVWLWYANLSVTSRWTARLPACGLTCLTCLRAGGSSARSAHQIGSLDSLWIQPRDRRAVQMSSERGIPAFSGRADGQTGRQEMRGCNGVDRGWEWTV